MLFRSQVRNGQEQAQRFGLELAVQVQALDDGFVRGSGAGRAEPRVLRLLIASLVRREVELSRGADGVDCQP